MFIDFLGEELRAMRHEQTHRSGDGRDDERQISEDVRERALQTRKQREDAAGQPAIEQYGPVDIRKVGALEAKALVHRPIAWMGAMMGDVDAFGYGQMTRGAIDLMLAGSCEDGLSLDQLADRALVGRGRMGERFGPLWHEAGGLAMRALHAYYGRRVLYEEITSVPTPTRRRDSGPGTDKRRSVARSRHYLVQSLGSAGRIVPETAMPFTFGTPDDHTSDRADVRRIARFSGQLGHALPGTPAEHVAIMLDRGRNVRARALRARIGRPDLFGRYSLASEAMARAFSPLLLIPELPYGAPVVPHRSSLGMWKPGLDRELVETVDAYGRHGVLACGALPEGETLSDDFELLPPMALPCAEELGISVPFGVQYLWSRSRQQVARRLVRRGTRIELWQLVGFTPGTLSEGLALIERHTMGWTLDCLERWVADCGIGLIRAYSAQMIEGVVDVLNLANAVIIEAYRRLGQSSSDR